VNGKYFGLGLSLELCSWVHLLLEFVVCALMNKADLSRMAAIKASGCILCLLVTGKTRPPDVHHLTSGSRRRGHQYTIGACPYHHRGLIPEGHTKQSISGLLGYSYAWGRKGFVEFFGSDDLLLKIQNLILDHFNESPWFDYIVPDLVRIEVQHLWGTR